MEFDTERIIDSNGQKYRVGWDEHGWFTIQMIRLVDIHPEWDTDDRDTVEYEGTDYLVETVGEYPNTSFTPAGAREVVDAIEADR